MKVVTIVGTRPELIKLSEVIRELDKHVDHVFVHTGQNYDYELNKVFFKELDIREPDYVYADAEFYEGKTVYEAIGLILDETDDILDIEQPDAVLILGDTNSSLAAYVAKRKHIPIFHMEAGNRCFDERVPEEINRKIVDHLSDINMPYTEHARRNLLNEGLKTDQIIKTGSPMYEIIMKHYVDIERRQAHEQLGLEKGGYYLVSCHREENVDNEERLVSFIQTLFALSEDLPVVVSTHPRLRKKISEDLVTDTPRIIWAKPFGFIDYCSLQRNAKCVISDSGTITEESSILAFPAVTIRQAHERPEGMDKGILIMADLKGDKILDAVKVVTSHQEPGRRMELPEDYINHDLAHQVVRIIMSYADYVQRRTWYGCNI